MANTIKLKNYLNVMEEYVAAGTIKPGHLIVLGSAGTVTVHNSASGNVLPMFACEDELQGKTIDDNYSSTNPVQCWIPQRGDVVNALLANGQNVVIGDFLESAGDGTLQKYVADSTGIYKDIQIVGIAVQAVNMSGSDAVGPSPRIAVRII